MLKGAVPEVRQVKKMYNKSSVQMEVLLDVLYKNGKIKLPVQGKSMEPFLKEGRDYVILTVPDGHYKKGDIVVYRCNGSFVMHRVTDINSSGFSIMGDNQLQPDYKVPKERIVAVVKKIFRNGKEITENDFVWKFYSDFYINLNVRKFFLKLHKIRKA